MSDLPCDTEAECPGGGARNPHDGTERWISPADGRHNWGRARQPGKEVCVWCGMKRDVQPKPPGPTRLEQRHGDVLRFGPRVASAARPSDLKRNQLSLKEKMAQIAQQGGRVRQLDRAEATRLGFDQAEIAEIWPNP